MSGSESESEEPTEQNPSSPPPQKETKSSNARVLLSGNPSKIGGKKKKAANFDASTTTQVPFASGSPASRTRSASGSPPVLEPIQFRSRPKSLARKSVMTPAELAARNESFQAHKEEIRIYKEDLAKKKAEKCKKICRFWQKVAKIFANMALLLYLCKINFARTGCTSAKSQLSALGLHRPYQRK